MIKKKDGTGGEWKQRSLPGMDAPKPNLRRNEDEVA